MFCFRMKEICKEQKCRYIVGVYTSPFLQRSSKNLGYQPIKEINFVNYVDPLTNEKPFKNMDIALAGIGMYLDTEK